MIQKCNFVEGIAFITMMLSSSAMDSEKILFPGTVCLLSSTILLIESMEQIENKMVVDWAWDEIEYGVPSRRRIKKERQAYEEAEREDSDCVQNRR